MDLDPLFLSRLAMGLGDRLAHPAARLHRRPRLLHRLARRLWFFTGREVWFRIARFWTRIFAVSFAMGVVSGIVMPFQFGTNWCALLDATANVISPLLAYEDLMAFFLEAAFLGVLLFGRRLVPRWAHFFAACMVAVGTLFSSFWILAANSWMQTPAGYEISDGRFFPVDWLAIIFNPSFPYRLAAQCQRLLRHHRLRRAGGRRLASAAAAAFAEAQAHAVMALGFLAIFVPLQIFLGDLHGLNTREYQPAKLAAIEGLWETAARAPLTLFGIPDEKAETNHDAVEIPASAA